MNFSNHIPIFAAILATVTVVGCSENSVTVKASVPTTKKVSTAKDHVAGVDETESDQSIPDDFPSDINLVEGAKSIDFASSGGKNNLILKYSESDNDDLVSSYLNGMSQKGWEQRSSSKLPIGTITNFTKDSRKCTISVSPPKANLITVAIIY